MQFPMPFLFRVVVAVMAMTYSGFARQTKNDGPEPTEKVTYKEVGGTKLELWVWKPAGWKATDKRSAIVFYHGGGWRGGAPNAFSRQSAKLAELGMVAISARYRLISQEGVKID